MLGLRRVIRFISGIHDVHLNSPIYAGEFKQAIEQLLDDTGDKKKVPGKIKTGKAGVHPGFKIPKIKLPKIKPIGIDSSVLKKFNIKIPGIKGFLQSFPASIKKSLSLSSSSSRTPRSHARGTRDFDKRKLLIILIPLLILLFMIIALAGPSPAKKPVKSIQKNEKEIINILPSRLKKEE